MFYFPSFSDRILCGLSGRNGDSNFKPKLYKVKGKRAPITTEIANVDWSNFSSKDVYVVHTERIIFIWVGRAASATEKLHAIKVSATCKKAKTLLWVFSVTKVYVLLIS